MGYDLDLADRIRELVGTERNVVEQAMFGGLAFLVNGNMSVAVSRQGGLLVRVDPAEVEPLISDKVAPAVMGGREMRGWLRVHEEVVESDDGLAEWVRRGVGYARSLPAKKGR
ncbi:TfoX/Sxy family protein [Kutzneria kofuensis]|uniref:TfoX/Sxy family transcriptional regulator of competence genes n=1 Tax=Kutzneria kofuensis TaxID=103725 RepID=A0A7W9KNN6_9PSEU|nr:TfoX/Sxy family protein [Kutzneria kofuensis]MBB5895903.1 TfoX/Sxy family transcriptional regulator of competence genes [Kutzneria kofuensis]